MFEAVLGEMFFHRTALNELGMSRRMRIDNAHLVVPHVFHVGYMVHIYNLKSNLILEDMTLNVGQ